MANQIKMAKIDTILTLHGRGWSRRRIARELGLDRETVGRHLRLHAAAADSNPAIPPAGIPQGDEANPAIPPAGIPQGDRANPAIPPAGIPGRVSLCRAHHESILCGVAAGLSAQRIYQDLCIEQGFAGAYDSVKRYVRRLTAGRERVERLECQPGEEAQVDFGLGAPILSEEGRRRRSWVFRIVLSHSRKGYGEAVFRQGTEEFIRCLENAFRHFGGVPRTLVIDNLRAAVTRADWYEPQITPKMAAFCRHYGTVVLPTRPRHPEHKGKVERGIGYVKGNALKKRSFATLAQENAFLRWWEEHVADQRIHGTTRQHVGRCFAERERAALQPLPRMLFPSYQEGLRAVHRDGYIELKRAYYRVPEEYLGRDVWVRWDGRLVQIFNQRMDPIATHVRLDPGRFSPSEPGSPNRSISETADSWCGRAGQIGPWCGEWAQRVRAERGIESIRTLIGLWQLGRRSGRMALDRACRKALEQGGALHLRTLRHLLDGDTGPEQLTFFERHPLIRDLGEYGALVAGAAPHPALPTTAPAGLEEPFGAAAGNAFACARTGDTTTPQENP